MVLAPTQGGGSYILFALLTEVHNWGGGLKGNEMITV